VQPAWIHLRLVERRQWWLWASAIVVTLLLTLGILSFTLQFFSSNQNDASYFVNLQDSVRGLFALVFLFDIYCIYQQLQIQRIRRQLIDKEEQLRQAHKMEAIGRLSGGIAHDFNNLLSVIIGYAEDLEATPHECDKARRNAGQIRKAGERAASLTRQLLAFSRQQVLQARVLDLNGTINDLGKMLRRLIGEDIEFILALDPAAGNVKVDQSQIEQVILNLAVNARDAMPEGGKLTIATANAQLDEKHAEKMPYVQPGSYVRLSVTDTGTGMDRETKAHIFEPFFTTKEKGKGTGLGLATVYGVVKQSGGYIWVTSEMGQGASFEIFLPQVGGAGPVASPKAQPVSAVSANSTILLVEDEDSLRELVSGLLAREGYRVLSASTGAQALEIARNFNDPIHLLLTDVVLPGINGPTLVKALSPHLAEMKVLYMSGYSEFQSYGGGGLPFENPLLQKPFTRETLLRAVGEALSPALADAHR
jgi:signal transduction histidine kinase/CheY-like chemotaxis protein